MKTFPLVKPEGFKFTLKEGSAKLSKQDLILCEGGKSKGKASPLVVS